MLLKHFFFIANNRRALSARINPQTRRKSPSNKSSCATKVMALHLHFFRWLPENEITLLPFLTSTNFGHSLNVKRRNRFFVSHLTCANSIQSAQLKWNKLRGSASDFFTSTFFRKRSLTSLWLSLSVKPQKDLLHSNFISRLETLIGGRCVVGF